MKYHEMIFHKLESIERDADTRLRGILGNVHDWPVAKGDKWQEAKFHWQDLLVALRNYGLPFNQLFGLELAVDHGNTSRYLLMVSTALWWTYCL